MAKKRRNRSRDYIEDVPIGALLILLFAAWSYIKEFWYIFLIIAVAVIAVVILIKVKKKKRKKVFAIDEIDAMDGIDFEDYTAGLLRRMGYRNVRVTQASGDFGVDVTAKLNDELWVFQCKRYTGNLGVKSVQEVFAGAEWFPTATPAPLFGFLPLITGTLWVSLFAILIALPFGLSVSIYMSEVADSKVRSWLKPVIELLSGIPSVVYGFFGLIVIVPLIQKVFDLPVGESGLAGSIVLAIMALPTIITVTEDAMRNCPRAMREASLALGASQWQTIYKVVIPYSISGITSGVVLGIGRAIGETMAVLMVTGNAAVIPTTILEPLRTIPATIAAELGEAPAGGPHYQALFLLGVVLFFITLIINFSVEYISSKGVKRSK